jgi:hypothetical protein
MPKASKHRSRGLSGATPPVTIRRKDDPEGVAATMPPASLIEHPLIKSRSFVLFPLLEDPLHG